MDSEWTETQQQKAAGDIVANLFCELTEANHQFAVGAIDSGEWRKRRQEINARLSVFGLSVITERGI